MPEPIISDSSISIAIIGGSGLYEAAGVEIEREFISKTPFGDSCPIIIGTLGGTRVAYIARHAKGHVYTPTTCPYQANIYALKSLGVRHVLAFSAVGSLQKEMKPRDLVVIEQFYDRTRHRKDTFFTEIAAHAPFSNPTSPEQNDLLSKSIISLASQLIGDASLFLPSSYSSDESLPANVFPRKEPSSYVCIEGPAFSTYTESITYRKLGFDIVGMTALTEAKLCCECEIAYSCVALVTDYDCWYIEAHEAVTAAMVSQVQAVNGKNAALIMKKWVSDMSERISEQSTLDFSVHGIMAGAIMTDMKCVDPAICAKLRPLLPKYIE
ncbi:Methylthioadenosine phosphorylase (MTAP) like protein [Aduncisulcus paluster]|uniref:S-methyl-5'-thioadenosine phosphorylase n=1 Tax=Aduncisulcus paluster TaxID=2918883 RepID=A0ABQ5KY37_9EUKA|nr:Methylthioadenosine phosphorylase (MTAP) like protein [Aduncisulcus paluster]|eukprot:gnl/Carplike_NY0171/2722_a3655_528.p1 GENE.gnl/Carplike_NY0171/2722_a3655_528~~gnl/Carplike_NY0171/2722_a3655_528.p1  ORF type:complete len:325 (-),score=100.20 gnl/Carplike_NY0171/2722_a3655_528:203-1177(-)